MAENKKTFGKGTQVLFESEGVTFRGQFLRRFSPNRNSGSYYEVLVENATRPTNIFCNGVVGRTFRKAV